MAKLMFCTTCWSTVRGRRFRRGSLLLELMLWAPPASLFFWGIVLNLQRRLNHTTSVDFANTALGSAVFISGLLAVVPFFYSVWRASTAWRGCDLCRSAAIVPEDSPVAREHLGTGQRQDNEKEQLRQEIRSATRRGEIPAV